MSFRKKLSNRKWLKPLLKGSLLVLAILIFGIGGSFLWNYYHTTPTLTSITSPLGDTGKEIQDSFFSTPAMPLTVEDKSYTFQDNKGGIQIQYANQEKKEDDGIKVSLPKNYSDPIEVALDKDRKVTIKDNSSDTYTSKLLSSETTKNEKTTLFQKLFPKDEGSKNYLEYQSDRKSLLYAYQKDAATGERKMKHWTIYSKGTGEEKESYTINGATIKKNDNGDINVYFQSEQDIKNDAVAKEVPQDLMERAQRTLEKELGNTNQNPDFIIPKPYYITKDNKRQDLEWNVDQDKKEISIAFQVSKDQYPIALDPTLQFTAPGIANGGVSISGEGTNNNFGQSFATGDLNADGKLDLMVGATYNADDFIPRVYIFYNDGSYPANAATADKVIEGDATTYYDFGRSLGIGDMNADGKADIIIGSVNSPAGVGRISIFYNDGSIPTTAAGADVNITGETDSYYFGASSSILTGDLNADGRTDLVLQAVDFDLTYTGRVYIFYNDGSYPASASSADVSITGEASGDQFGSLTTGDLNADGKSDLVVVANTYSSNTGRAYIFYNDGSYPASASSADVTITGSTDDYFGVGVTTGDLNADGRTDLIVGAYNYPLNSGDGGIFIFYSDGSYPSAASGADVIISGNGYAARGGIKTGDFNNDKRIDLAVEVGLTSFPYSAIAIFYNDGSIPTTIDKADVIITDDTRDTPAQLVSGDFNNDGTNDLAVTSLNQAYYGVGHVYIFYSQNGVLNTNQNITGNATNDDFGNALAAADLNADGRTDLIVGAYGYSSTAGRAYIFYNDGSIPTTAATADVTITGESTSSFGVSLTTADFNADGKTDLVVGGDGYSTQTGRAYIFYNDGSIPTTAATADVIITGTATTDYFGTQLAVGDLNSDGREDLIVGSAYYSSIRGRAYIFYNDGSIPTTAATADVIINGTTGGDYFGQSLITGDFNSDGRTDVAIGASGYSSFAYTGRVYIFYNDGSIPTTAATADVIITGETTSSGFGISLATADLNNDGKNDLVVGANQYSSSTGRAYIFYNDGSIPTTAATADVIITGETSSSFGDCLTTGDMNADGKKDLVVSGLQYSSNAGRLYVFYNDGSIPTTAATADMTITGESTSSFGASLTTADFNADGKTDLVVGAIAYSGSAGSIYFYSGQDNFSWTLQAQPIGTNRVQPNVTGQELQISGNDGSGSTNFGYVLESGDFNADGKVDIAVGAEIYTISSAEGSVYIFYGDGDYPAGSNSADVIIRGSASSGRFGRALESGDFNADGKTDLIVGASGAVSAYIFYNDGDYPATASRADVTITGVGTAFADTITAGDFNSDGRTDFALGDYGVSSNAGAVYIFYNDGSIPTTSATADVTITGNATNDLFGLVLTAADLNFDGKVDLAVGAYGYSSNTGRAYIFYNDGSIPTTAATADVTITGNATSDNFGRTLEVGDLNADGRVDLIVGAQGYSSTTGRAYIFYNDGSIPTTAATADVTITGNASNDTFSVGLATGDLNADGRTDLIVGAFGYSSSIGRAYIFYNDGSIPTTAATADVTITGQTSTSYFGRSFAVGDINADGKRDLIVGAYGYNGQKGKIYMYTMNDKVITGGATSDYFGSSLESGDFNSDGKVDLAVGAYGYSSSTGRVYIFYNGSGAITTSSADVTITGNAAGDLFGTKMKSGDLNADGKIDLAVGANGYSSGTGRAYIFYNDGSIPTTAATADVTITGNATNDSFGSSLMTGDLNADGKIDLAVGASGYSSATGRAYIFYNDGSIPTTAATADVTITGDTGSTFFGGTSDSNGLSVGDLNADGRTDLVVGARSCAPGGCAYIFYNDGSIPTTAATADVIIAGESNSSFGTSLTTGDLNADGKTDLVVGAYSYSGSAGRAYIFYNDGSIPTTAATADVTITGTTANAWFGDPIKTGDLNADGKTDLVIGSWDIGSVLDHAYIFYNDGSYPSTIASADMILTGAATTDEFSNSFNIADFNLDGINDLVVGAYGYSTNTGRVFTFVSETKVTAVDTNAAEFKGSSGVIKGSFELK